MANRRAAAGLILFALSLVMYILYLVQENLLFGILSIALFVPAFYLTLSEVGFLRPVRAILPFITSASALSLAFVTLHLDDYLDKSYYGALTASASTWFTGLLLNAMGIGVTQTNQVLYFSPSSLSKVQALNVTPICAGIYSSVIFLALFGVMVADLGRGAKKRNLAVAVTVGVIGIQATNVFRISILVLIGYQFGYDALSFAHQYLGYVMFLAFMVVFFWVSLRWLQPGVPGSSKTRQN